MIKWFKMRPGGAIRENGEYWMGKKGSGLI
jgi:hypothetical protein